MHNLIPFKKILLVSTVGGLMIATGVAQAAQVSYNTTSSVTGNGLRTSDQSVAGPLAFAASSNSAYGNAGTPAYTGNLPATWYSSLKATDHSTVKTSEMASGMGITALTTGAKAYQDVGTASNAATFKTNWGHNADFGLFHLQAATDKLTITVAADGSQLSPGFSVWQGWDTSTSSTRHQTWLNNGATKLQPGSPGVFGSDLGTFEGTAWTATSGGSATLTLNNLVAGDYTLILGGFSDKTCTGSAGSTCTFSGGLGGLNAKYMVSFDTNTAVSAVPVPGAVWLFGSAIAGIASFGRRKTSLAA